MSPYIRRMLWGAFFALALLTVGGVTATIAILQMEQRMEFRIVQESRPLLDSVRAMDEALGSMSSAARGFLLTRQTAFVQQYDDAVRAFETHAAQAIERSTHTRDRELVRAFRMHYQDIRRVSDQQIASRREDGQAERLVLQVAEIRRTAPDYAALIADRIRNEQTETLNRLARTRQWLMMAMVFVGVAVLGIGAAAVWRIERSLS